MSYGTALVMCLGCGPGGIGLDDGGFGESGTENAGVSTTAASGSASASTGDSSGDGDGDGDPGDGDGEPDSEDSETETGSDSWTHPETESESETGEPEPIPAPTCDRTWVAIDTIESHGHIGATPITGRPDGGFVSATPLLGAGNDEVNVDAWFRSWTSEGDIEWERLVSWADHRDDPLVLHHDELGDLFAGGRIDANMQTENAMISALDGQNGDFRWTFLRGEGGGYTSLAYNGAAVVAAGNIGEFGQHRLELLALDPDTGDELWSAMPELALADVQTRGLVFVDGVIHVLVSEADGFGNLDLLRIEPPAEAAELLATLVEFDEGLAPGDLERFGSASLAALYSIGTRSYLAKVARSDGNVAALLSFDDLELATNVWATELAVTPHGLAVAGTAWDLDNDKKTFIAHFDEQLDLVCIGMFGKADQPDTYYSPELRGLAASPDGELITASYALTSRQAVFARWE